MKERIEAIIKRSGLNPSKFADKLGVQRSGVSHILSGRNNPSLDFLMKVLSLFPDISGDWLITGEGNMIKGKINTPSVTQLTIESPPKIEDLKTEVSANTLAPTHKPTDSTFKPKEKTVETPLPMSTLTTNSEKEVERIVVFYKDKTFRDYRPE